MSCFGAQNKKNKTPTHPLKKQTGHGPVAMRLLERWRPTTRLNGPASFNIAGRLRFSWTVYSLGMLAKSQLCCSAGVWPAGFNKGNMGSKGQGPMEKPDGNFGRGLKQLQWMYFWWQKKDAAADVDVFLTEKILTELLSSLLQRNLALRLVSRSSSIRGGFTNTTYGLNSGVHKRWSFCEGHRRCFNPKRRYRRLTWCVTIIFHVILIWETRSLVAGKIYL